MYVFVEITCIYSRFLNDNIQLIFHVCSFIGSLIKFLKPPTVKDLSNLYMHKMSQRQ